MQEKQEGVRTEKGTGRGLSGGGRRLKSHAGVRTSIGSGFGRATEELRREYVFLTLI